MVHDHGHSHGSAAPGRPASAGYRRRLAGVLCILAGIAVLEIVVGFASGSLALLSDAGHIAVDVLGVAMTLAAVHAAASGARRAHRTYGLYRIEVLSTLANALLLFGVAIWVLYEAIGRFQEPPDVPGPALIIAATIGLAGNIWAFTLLRHGASEALSIKGASMEVLADTIASVGAIIAGVVLTTTGWRYVDPIVASGVALMILPRAAALGRAAIRVLLEMAPRDVDMPAVEASLNDINGVIGVHDLHIWTVTSGMESATAHLSVATDRAAPAVLAKARACLAEHGIEHATVQIETTGGAGCCADSTW